MEILKKEKRREEKPYPEDEILFPLGGQPLLPSTTPIADSFIHSFSDEKREDERKHTGMIRIEFECTVVKRGEREVMERERREKKHSIDSLKVNTMIECRME